MAAVLLAALLLFAGCAKIGGGVQRVHTVTLIIGPVVQSQGTELLQLAWVCTSSAADTTLSVRCVPHAPHKSHEPDR